MRVHVNIKKKSHRTHQHKIGIGTMEFKWIFTFVPYVMTNRFIQTMTQRLICCKELNTKEDEKKPPRKKNEIKTRRMYENNNNKNKWRGDDFWSHKMCRRISDNVNSNLRRLSTVNMNWFVYVLDRMRISHTNSDYQQCRLPH